jgi:ABC-type sugar transport system ATPase subunit
MTVIHVTHDQEEAMAIADRIAVLNNGLLIQVGRPEEIYSSPSSLFLFKFIGLSNTIPGSLLGLEREEIVGFRPEDARLSKSSGRGCITVKILRIQFAGSHRIVVASIKDQWEEVKIFVRTEPDSEFEEGSQACLEIEREKVIIFKDGKMVKKGL